MSRWLGRCGRARLLERRGFEAPASLRRRDESQSPY